MGSQNLLTEPTYPTQPTQPTQTTQTTQNNDVYDVYDVNSVGRKTLTERNNEEGERLLHDSDYLLNEEKI